MAPSPRTAVSKVNPSKGMERQAAGAGGGTGGVMRYCSPLAPCMAGTCLGFRFEELDRILHPGLGMCPSQVSRDMPVGPAPAGSGSSSSLSL